MSQTSILTKTTASNIGNNKLMLAILRNEDKTHLKELISLPDFAINHKNILDQTALHIAVICEHQDALDLILRHPEVDGTLKDKFGKTASDYMEEAR
jgi:ankyrin repeat protein